MSRPQWYPNDWTEQTVIIVASGPSAAFVDLDKGIGRAKFVAINRSINLCPWADIWYCCDFQWWNKYFGDPGFRKEVGEYPRTVKVCVDYRIRENRKWGVQFLNCERPADVILWEPGTVGWGGNSGFNCLNMVAQFMPAKIIIVGFDMTRQGGAHWHDPHPKGLSNPTSSNIERWRRVMENAAQPMAEAGICVINVSQMSALRKYARMSLNEALDYVPGDPLPRPIEAPIGPSPIPRRPLHERRIDALAKVKGHLARKGKGREATMAQVDYIANRVAERL